MQSLEIDRSTLKNKNICTLSNIEGRSEWRKRMEKLTLALFTYYTQGPGTNN